MAPTADDGGAGPQGPAPMDLQNDLFAHWTLVRKKS